MFTCAFVYMCVLGVGCVTIIVDTHVHALATDITLCVLAVMQNSCMSALAKCTCYISMRGCVIRACDVRVRVRCVCVYIGACAHHRVRKYTICMLIVLGNMHVQAMHIQCTGVQYRFMMFINTASFTPFPSLLSRECI